MTEALNSDAATHKLVELAKDIHIAMLTTVDDEGHLTSRPMAHQQVEADGDLWFFVEKSSPTSDGFLHRRASPRVFVPTH